MNTQKVILSFSAPQMETLAFGLEIRAVALLKSFFVMSFLQASYVCYLD